MEGGGRGWEGRMESVSVTARFKSLAHINHTPFAIFT